MRSLSIDLNCRVLGLSNAENFLSMLVKDRWETHRKIFQISATFEGNLLFSSHFLLFLSLGVSFALDFRPSPSAFYGHLLLSIIWYRVAWYCVNDKGLWNVFPKKTCLKVSGAEKMLSVEFPDITKNLRVLVIYNPYLLQAILDRWSVLEEKSSWNPNDLAGWKYKFLKYF